MLMQPKPISETSSAPSFRVCMMLFPERFAFALG
jgi:hypothetical protein